MHKYQKGNSFRNTVQRTAVDVFSLFLTTGILSGQVHVCKTDSIQLLKLSMKAMPACNYAWVFPSTLPLGR